MTLELNVLREIGARLEVAGVPFMVTGSMALAYYATPRMTRDIDIVVALTLRDLDRLQAALSTDFFFDLDAALEAIRRDRLFNIMHLATAIKIDLIVRKATEYRHVEFARRQPVSLGSVPTWIVTREDLILSKLEWSKDSGSEMQRRDVRQLLSVDLDWAYLDLWAPTLGVVEALQALRP